MQHVSKKGNKEKQLSMPGHEEFYACSFGQNSYSYLVV